MDVVPHSRQAEEGLLGAVLINPKVFYSISLNASDFYIHRHAVIWDCLTSLFKRSINPDIITLTDELDKDNKLEEIGGHEKIVFLINMTATSLHAQDYAEIVREKAARRRIILTASELAKAAYDESSRVDDAISKSVKDLAMGVYAVNGADHISKHVDNLYDIVEHRYNNPDSLFGIPTGFIDIDRVLGGLDWRSGLVWYIAGEPGVGKSILSVQIAMNAAKSAPVAIFSLEMRSEMLMRRIISAQGQFPTQSLKTGELGDDGWAKFIQACEVVTELPVYISDASSMTISQLRADVARLKSQHDIKVIVVDYLYLLSGLEGMDMIPRTEELSAGIVRIAKEFQVAAITVNSVTKEYMGKGKAPSQGGIRGSGQLAHDADLISFLVKRDDDYDPGIYDLMFVKSRDNDIAGGQVSLRKTDGYPSFQSLVVRNVDYIGVGEDDTADILRGAR